MIATSPRRPSSARLWLACALCAGSVACGPSTPAAPPSAALPSSGLDLTAMDRSLQPGDDFFNYVNGAWVARTEIPADRSRWGAFDVLAEEAAVRTRALLEEASAAGAGPGAADAQKARDYYATVLDEAAIDAAGTAPLAAALRRIGAIRSRSDLARVLGEDLRADVDPLNTATLHTDRLFGLWVSPDLNDPSRNAAYLLQGGLDLPDREYYVGDSPRMADIRQAYDAHVATMLRLGGEASPAAAAKAVVALEAKMARVHATAAESFDVLKANNPWPLGQFPAKAPGLDWTVFFTAAGLNDQAAIVAWHPTAIAGLSRLAASEPIAVWKQWLAFHEIDRHAGVLPKAFDDARFGFHGGTLSGTPRIADRWKRAVAATNGAMGDAVGRLYVARHFSPEAKAQVEALVKNLIAAFGARIDRLDWMSAQTKARAREKLATLRVFVGYPDAWADYGALQVVRGDAFGNGDRAELFEYRRSLARLHGPVDRTEWWMTPQTVNALNLPIQNALNFPAAILAPPFFDAAAPAAVNYGGIGAVIGHEISHSFDDQGAQFDAEGRLRNWWTKEDLAHFQASGAQLAAQYDRYAPFPDLHVNGRQTLGENIGDLAGLATAYDAWQASLGGAPAPTVPGPDGQGALSGPQQFFLSYGQIWRSKSRDAALRQQVITNGHAPNQYRTATVRNIDAWYAAFDPKPGQALFLAPADRVRVW